MQKYSKEDTRSYSLGMSLSIEAVKNVPQFIECVYLSSRAYKNEQLQKLLDICEKNHVDCVEDDQVIDKLSLKENCYAITYFKKFYRPLRTDRHVVLYHFTDYGELGTIMRSAVSFDFEDLVLIDSDIDYFDPRVVRASMGAIFHLNIRNYRDFDSYFRDYDHHIYPFISKGDKELHDLRLQKPYSLIIPQNYEDLDDIFSKGYSLKHQGFREISLSTLSSIVLNYCYHQNAVGMNIGHTDQK